MKEPRWVLDETVLALHEQLLTEFGGASGVRDLSMLASALARPKHRFDYATPPMAELAAAYAFGIIKNHPFVDGNKRTGFAVAVLFLELNGFRFAATEVDATVQTLALAAGDLPETGYARWLATHAQTTGTVGKRAREGRVSPRQKKSSAKRKSKK